LGQQLRYQGARLLHGLNRIQQGGPEFVVALA
jgi:hypothetical protein